MKNELKNSWDKVTILLENCIVLIDNYDVVQILEFINNNELQLALEDLVEAGKFKKIENHLYWNNLLTAAQLMDMNTEKQKILEIKLNLSN